jgi:hypothetical protein
MTPVIAPMPARTSSNILKYCRQAKMTRFGQISASFWSANTEAIGEHVLQAGVKKLFDFCRVHGWPCPSNRTAVFTMLESRAVQLTGPAT